MEFKKYSNYQKEGRETKNTEWVLCLTANE